MNDTTMEWRRSSFCGESTCVEVAPLDGRVLIRDGKNPAQPHLSFSRADWNAFLDRVEAGQAV